MKLDNVLTLCIQNSTVLCTEDVIGFYCLVNGSVSKNAKFFYEKYGFTALPMDEMTLMIRIKDAIAIFQ